MPNGGGASIEVLVPLYLSMPRDLNDYMQPLAAIYRVLAAPASQSRSRAK